MPYSNNIHSIEVYINGLIEQFGIPYDQARNQAAALFAIDLDAPLFLQYLSYIRSLLHGDLGTSLLSAGTPVSSIILRFLPWTIFSVGIGLLTSFTLGIILGMVMAYRRESAADHVLSALASVLSSVPNYLIAMMLVVFLGVQWKLVDIAAMRGSMSPGMQPGFNLAFLRDVLYHASLPILTYVITTIGTWMLTMKSSTISTLGEDYVTVAKARGLPERRITTAYVGRNAALPLFTQLTIAIGFIVGGSEEWQALLQEFNNYRPEQQIVSGPYKIDTASITEAQLTLVKVPTAWDADQVKFDKIVLYNGETPDVTPVVMAKEVDYATHGFPPATEKAFVEQGVRIIRPPIYSGPAIYFNYDIYPLNRVEVRQAIAHAINRDDNAIVSLGQSAKPPVYMAGFSDNLVPLWITEADLAQFESYQYDTAKAEQILTGIGFTRDSDGVWVDDQGKRMEYELTVPAEYADWSAAAENVAEQLTTFGVKTTVRGVTFTQHPVEVNQGKFQLAIRAWGAGNPHPHFSFVQDFFTHNYVQAAEGKGMNFPLTQTVGDLGELNLEEMVVASAEGLDEASQKATVVKLALAFNKLLPIVPLWERYGNNPTLDGVRVTGWPPEGDPIYKNSPYSDNFVIVMILDGRLHPVAR